MSFRVEVTMEDLKNGKKFGIDDGFLSLAIIRAFEAHEVFVYRESFYIRRHSNGQSYILPEVAVKASRDFDNGLLIMPFGFIIEAWALANNKPLDVITNEPLVFA